MSGLLLLEKASADVAATEREIRFTSQSKKHIIAAFLCSDIFSFFDCSKGYGTLATLGNGYLLKATKSQRDCDIFLDFR